MFSCFRAEQELSDVDRQLEESRLKGLCHFKVLLLGAGECGKSTVLKQIKLVHRIEFTDEEMKNFGINLRRNTVQSMQTLLEAIATVPNPPVLNDTLKPLADLVSAFDFQDDNCSIPPPVVEAIQVLWPSEPIQQIFDRRDEYWCLDSIDYYFENVERFCDPEFSPNEDDCVMARIITTGIVTTEFSKQTNEAVPISYQVIDVGGQRNERRKWIHCFDDVTAIVYLVNLAGYASVLYEDPTVNRMTEALSVFENTVNNDTFGEVPIFLLLNKKDLFESLIKRKDLSTCFPDYQDGADVRKAISFISQQFRQRLKVNPNRLSEYPVSARVKREIRDAWTEIDQNLQDMHKDNIKEASKGLEKMRRHLEKVDRKKIKEESKKKGKKNRSADKLSNKEDSETGSGNGPRSYGSNGAPASKTSDAPSPVPPLRTPAAPAPAPPTPAVAVPAGTIEPPPVEEVFEDKQPVEAKPQELIS